MSLTTGKLTLNNYFKSEAVAVGLAMFSMFFGAGNIIYPLAVGQYAGDKNLFAILGLILTAAIMPMAGVMAMILYEGNYRQFFGRLGHFPGFILALTIISLLGPLGSTPRCIALSYTTLKNTFPMLSLELFSAGSCILIFLMTVNKKHILSLLGWILTPFLLLSLCSIIIVGLVTEPSISILEASHFSLFLHGLYEGYNTMDLLAAFFFSSTILTLLKIKAAEKGELHGDHYLKTAFLASLIGTGLLTLIYIGFSYISSFHASSLTHHAKDELLAAIMMKIAGPYAGLLVCIAIALACLTTAIALISAFADFIQREVFNNRADYRIILLGSLILTFLISTLEFNGISSFLWPILQIFYPGLIVLTFLNVANRLFGVQTVKVPVFITFGLSTGLYFFY